MGRAVSSVCLSVSVIHVAAVTNMNPGRDQLERRWSTVDQWRRQRGGRGEASPLWVYGKIGRQLIWFIVFLYYVSLCFYLRVNKDEYKIIPYQTLQIHYALQ